MNNRRTHSCFNSIFAVFMVLAMGLSVFASSPAVATETIAGMNVSLDRVTWEPTVDYQGISLVVSGPDGSISREEFISGDVPVFGLVDGGGPRPDGGYSYELTVVPVDAVADTGVDAESRGLGISRNRLVQSGHFTILDGGFVFPEEEEGAPPAPVARSVVDKDPGGIGTLDVLHYDDVIATGSLCVGFDCVNGEAFGYDTIKLKENNLRIFFEDTSIGSFPTTDWRFWINDTTSGGAGYFAIVEQTAGTVPFRIEAGAPNHALYVEDYGRVGLGTSIPYVELHIVDGDSPTVRLDQDGTSGWAPQKWDLVGNETNFFIRDVTNGSKLTFRIQPNSPSDSLTIRSSGNVGIGTWSPEYPLEVERTGTNASIVLDRTDGAMNYVNATSQYANFGSVNDYPLRLVVNSDWRMRLNNDDSISFSNGAAITSGGVWQNGSSRELKDSIRDLEVEEAMQALEELRPVRFVYRNEMDEEYLGFIAEEVPELVASKDRKGLSSMDIVALLTKVVKEQQTVIRDQRDDLRKVLEKVSELEKKIVGQ